MELKLTGNQKRFLEKHPTKAFGDLRLVFAYTDAQLRVAKQLEELGLLKRYPSSTGFWTLS